MFGQHVGLHFEGLELVIFESRVDLAGTVRSGPGGKYLVAEILIAIIVIFCGYNWTMDKIRKFKAARHEFGTVARLNHRLFKTKVAVVRIALFNGLFLDLNFMEQLVQTYVVHGAGLPTTVGLVQVVRQRFFFDSLLRDVHAALVDVA